MRRRPRATGIALPRARDRHVPSNVCVLVPIVADDGVVQRRAPTLSLTPAPARLAFRGERICIVTSGAPRRMTTTSLSLHPFRSWSDFARVAFQSADCRLSESFASTTQQRGRLATAIPTSSSTRLRLQRSREPTLRPQLSARHGTLAETPLCFLAERVPNE